MTWLFTVVASVGFKGALGEVSVFLVLIIVVERTIRLQMVWIPAYIAGYSLFPTSLITSLNILHF